MKKILLILALFTIPAFGYSQIGTTVDYLDNFGPITLNHDGLVNGKHSYTGTDAGATVIITWTGVRWELTINVGGGDVLSFSSPVNTVMNPPNLTIGAWVDEAADGTDLTGLSGSGTTGTVLPVELLGFKGEINKNSFNLVWKTSSEINNEKFEIEESFTGRQFHKIGEVKGNETTFELNDYSFTVEKPKSGVSYYRLKQIDFDGQFEYSDVINLELERADAQMGILYPNPSQSGKVNLDYSSDDTQNILVSVFDVTGKLVYTQDQSVVNGNNNLNLNFSSLSKGMYFVKIGNEINSILQRLIIE